MQNRVKIICFFLSLLLLAPTLSVWAQEDQKIDISLRNAPLKDFLASIEKQTDYTFMYKNLNMEQKLTLNLKSKPLNQLLTEVLNSRGIVYKFSGKRIFLEAKENGSEDTSNNKDNFMNVKGTVIDESGIPLIGVAVKVEGTDIGTLTDMNGLYEIMTNPKAVIQFSYIGYKTKRESVKGRSTIDITMEEDSKLLDEVVVVGYGTQKKVNLTGSVASVTGKELETRPIANSVTGLQGMLPGVTIQVSNSRPGDSQTKIRVRGIGTWHDSNPLVLIDGIEGNINILNPDDIESVSVLKDAASSAIYGSRAANGVILVTTKKATRETKPTINYNGYYAIQMPASKPEMLGSVDYLNLLKEAQQNIGSTWSYKDEDIEAIMNGTNPNYLANTNWIDEVMKSSAPQHGHNFSINGGTKEVGYYASYGYLSTDGLATNNAYHSTRNNLRAKIDTEILDRVTLEANIGYTDVDNWSPAVSDSGTGGIYYQALRSSPLVPVKFTSGGWGYGGSSANPVAIANDGGFTNYKSQETTVNLVASIKIMEGLSVKAQYGTAVTNVLRKSQSNIVEHFTPETGKSFAFSSNTSSLNQRDIYRRNNTINLQGDYDKSFGNHNLHLLFGYSQEWFKSEQMDAGGQDLISDDLHTLNTATDKFTASGSASNWALRSLFGRLNYNFSDRYLFEANFRYDLSSRFHKDNRSSFFPSGSFAWRLSEESFMLPTKEYIDNIKFRLSYGTLGNQYTDNLYNHVTEIRPGNGMPIGDNINKIMQQISGVNKKLSWETIHMLNAGLDFNLFNNRLAFSGDYFIKNTKDILLNVKLPGVFGVNAPDQNAGKVENKGWELNLSWRDNIGSDFDYGLKFSLSDVKNKVKSVGPVADDFSGYRIRAVGYPIDAFWGYQANGLADFGDFVYNPTTDYYNPTIPIIEGYRTDYAPGDIKYIDQNTDGQITPEDDRTYLGSDIPRYTYSFGADLKWKGLDFSFFFQGVAKANGYINGLGRHAYTEIANNPQKEHLGRWSFNNPDPNASYPRFTYGKNYNQSNVSSYWIEDASYLRLKNIQLGYTLKPEWLKALRVQNCRLYVSGENLLTFSDYFGSYDPETPVSGGGFYPVVKSVSFGLSITLR